VSEYNLDGEQKVLFSNGITIIYNCKLENSYSTMIEFESLLNNNLTSNFEIKNS